MKFFLSALLPVILTKNCSLSNHEERNGLGMWQGIRYTDFLWGDLMERDHFDDLVADRRITLK
jgi:hypothetical protein